MIPIVLAYLHSDVSTHDVVVWYEDMAVAVVFTLWAYDWVVEKLKARKKTKRKK